MAKTAKSSVSTRSTGAMLSPQANWFEKLTETRKDLICIVLLYVIVVLVFNKIAFNNMIFADSGDTKTHEEIVRGIEHIKTTQHLDPLWLPYVFSGMPIFGTMIFPLNENFVEIVVGWIGKALFFGCEMSWVLMHFFLAGAFMYLLARSLKFPALPSLLASLTLMLNPMAIELPQAGHGSKLIALSYLPLMLYLTIRLFERRNILSLALLVIASATMLLANHVQMAFYGFMLIGLYLAYQVIVGIKAEPIGTAKNIGLFVIAIALGFAIAAYEYLPTQEYSKYSIRGGTSGGEGGAAGAQTGLSYDYATNWSFHPWEAFNYLVPTTFGLSSQYVTDWQGQETPLPLYWGWMPFTTSTVYIGIVPIILAILALIYRRNKMTIFLAAVSVIFFLLSFGRFSPFIYDLMFNYFPYFNKFRVPVMILHMMPITVGLLAAFGLNFLLDLPSLQKEINIVPLRKRLTVVAIAVGGILILGSIARSGVYGFLSDFMFHKSGELQQYAQQYGQQSAQQLVAAFQEKRFDVFWGGYLKFAVFTCLTLGAIILYLRGKMQRFMMGLVCIGILAVDLLLIDTTYYINPKPNTSIAEQFTPNETISRLQAESDTSLFRVYPVESFEDDEMAAFHIPSVGGYSPAKLKIYQEMRDSCNLDRGNLNVVSMLNVKYFYRTQQAKDGSVQNMLQPAPTYLPRAWFVDKAEVVASKHELFGRMNLPSFNPRQVALLEKPLAAPVETPDSSATVKVTSYTAHDITLDARTDKPALMVLSEIYYPAGWTATIDGVETEIYKTNYILRSVVVPAGKHTIAFHFAPKSYEVGNTVTQAGWGVAALLLIVGLVPVVRKRMAKA